MPARVGQTLLEAAELHNIDIEAPCRGSNGDVMVRRSEKWVESLYGEGPGCYYCHVQIASKYNSILPEQFSYVRDGMENVYDEEITKTSRLACMITLDHRHDGMVILVPDAPVCDVI